jgi:ABC-type transport system involved in multi-copper enzyme maturation permease subunit
VLLAAPYSILLIDNEFRKHESYIVEMAFVAAVASEAVAVLTLTLLGGHAIAGERDDRSVEFLAYLPVSRWSNMISKLVWPLVMALLVIGVNIAVVYLMVKNSKLAADQYSRIGLQALITPVAFMWSLGFSTAWLGSAVLRSPAFAVVGSILASVSILLATMLIVKFVPATQVRYPDQVIWSILAVVVPLIACSCFFAGCRIYLRRVEP